MSKDSYLAASNALPFWEVLHLFALHAAHATRGVVAVAATSAVSPAASHSTRHCLLGHLGSPALRNMQTLSG